MAIIRVNTNAYESGELYLSELQNETEKNFAILLSLLSSYWKSTVDGPNYARSLKAIAIALSQIRLSLNNIYTDSNYTYTRSEYLYQVLTNLMFPKEAPNLESNDSDFREFLNNLIPLYFAGSVPDSIKSGIALLTGGEIKIYQMYEEAQKPGSGYDISDQFMFGIDVILDSPGQTNTLLSDRNIRILLQILRPAHTLYKIKFILKEEYTGNQTVPTQGQPYQPNKILDNPIYNISDYSYEDFRRFNLGVKEIDDLGRKTAKFIEAEDHSADF